MWGIISDGFREPKRPVFPFCRDSTSLSLHNVRRESCCVPKEPELESQVIGKKSVALDESGDIFSVFTLGGHHGL